MIHVKNPSNVDVKDYPFKFATYTVKSGEVVALPDDAANYLLKVYQFLVKADAPKVSEVVRKVELPKVEEKELVEDLSELIAKVEEKTGKKVVGKYKKDKTWLENKLK